MTTLVVVESLFGNTRAIADAVADGLSAAGPVTVVGVDDAPATPADDVTLLVVGAPTHAFSLSRPNTRKAAEDQGAEHHPTGVREWLAALPADTSGRAAAAFSTRIPKKFVPGSAAKAAARRLGRLGYRPAAPPEDYFVLDTAGPLRAGEIDRARAWGKRLAKAVNNAPRR
ncbi:flavodoxin family protein [Cryptosporangium aurantiacum]|uniref:Flavodoxin n=1 Tax=Cryptosporangium aurantiacum TaxID=134849 RepID=A0A1M7TYZ8_9ACTN|nr:flavodoxin family protein [Cryptosporangium aurantiacum]SHN75934.1 Flavodoxin [Cryptosporangium aurantiacum]